MQISFKESKIWGISESLVTKFIDEKSQPLVTTLNKEGRSKDRKICSRIRMYLNFSDEIKDKPQPTLTRIKVDLHRDFGYTTLRFPKIT